MSNPPTSTYRLQIQAEFDLDAAVAVVDYLKDLGVGAVYLSPILRATKGSTHGYDVTDHREIDPDRGGPRALSRLTAAARAAGLDVVVDLVPNHAGVADATQNPAWWDVLTYGRDSRFAEWFDIDWPRAPILLPVLGDDADLAAELTVEPSSRTGSGLELHYYEHAFPVAPRTGPAPGDTAVDVLERQHYRLAGYRAADDEMNYRRFFAVTELAGLRVEDPAVFDDTHRVMLERVTAGEVIGLRIDHPDGLVDPLGYLQRLHSKAPDAWITVEKILEPGEELPSDWPVAGTTGYDALTEITQVITDPAGAAPLTEAYLSITGDERDFKDHVADGKRMIATGILHAEITRLVLLVPEVSGAAAALTELAVAFPVYRSYMPLGSSYLDDAIALALSRNPSVSVAVNALLPRLRDPDDELCRRFQQVTGAIMAKGVEDTAYYRYTRAIWLNEVGGDPGVFGEPLSGFHAAQVRRQASVPGGMTTLSTHDTKRGEDVRARLAVLAELPQRWVSVANALHVLVPLPDPAFGLLIWQTFIGAGFIERERMHAYVEKAMREANTGSTWREPAADFEAAMHGAVNAGYDNAEVHAILNSLMEDVAAPGWSNAVSQKLIALTMPGVPDVYQGTELWDDSLVDPDNRRLIDYSVRRRVLAAVSSSVPPLDESGAAKLRVTSQVLRLRRDRPELFTSYTALSASGPAADHLVSYDRGGAVALATRLPVGLRALGGWTDTSLSVGARHAVRAGEWEDVLTGDVHSGPEMDVAAVLRTYPVALLVQR
ncbi:MAG: maltooligosyl trehalose synthase [Pseudonocardiales bacterium]|nr:maltooligosyl trehalose synthase [Pseudonocardiales bacterium]